MSGPGVSIKAEVDVKLESGCVACGLISPDVYDIYTTQLQPNNTLYSYLCKFSQTELSDKQNFCKYICRSCYDLITLLIQTEQEYKRLKQCFEQIISKNPLFCADAATRCETLGNIKTENEENFVDVYSEDQTMDMDSEDEPLAITKKKRKKNTKKKKKNTKGKKKIVDLPVFSNEEDDVHNNDSTQVENSLQNNGCLEDKKEIKVEEDIDTKTDNKRKKRPTHTCEHCNATFTSVARLEKHLSCHGAGPPYVCEVCGAHYKHRRACLVHVQMHKGISEWKCVECERLFPSKGALARHNNIHTGTPNYQCDQCGKSFIHTSSFKMHKLSHSGVKPHVCGECGLALMTSSHLKRHQRIHSGEKRFHCPHHSCGKRFSERYNLVAHLRSHSPGEVTAPLQKHKPIHFRCPYCSQRFERRILLERHTQLEHSRTLERAAPRPRNTMSKLLKAQARGATIQQVAVSRPESVVSPVPPTPAPPAPPRLALPPAHVLRVTPHPPAPPASPFHPHMYSV